MSFNKKIILAPGKPIVRREAVVTVPGVENLIADALGTIELELVKFRNKVNRGESLELPEGRLLTLYVKSLVDLSRESRERARTEDLSKMSDEELAELAKKLVNQNKPPTEDSGVK